jgi:arsenate reductase
MPPAIGPPVKVLFVCLGNSCRSQMAEALARHTAADVMVAESAGTMALGVIADLTREVLQARGILMDGQFSKQLQAEQKQWADVIVNMTGRPAREVFPDVSKKVEDWDVTDPYGRELAMFETTYDEIESRVGDLARRLRQKQALEEQVRRAAR